MHTHKIDLVIFVIFDWDGTVSNSTKRNHYATSNAFREVFEREMRFPVYRDLMNFPTKRMYVSYGIDGQEFDAKNGRREEAFNKHYNDWPHAVGTTPGARGLLHWLRARRIPCAIVSNHDEPSIRADLKRLHLASLFQDVSGRPEHLHISNGSNKLERVAAILKKHGVRPGEAVIFGDSLQEIEIARTLGMRVISVGCGDTAPRRLVRARPDAYVSTLAHAVPVLARWCDGGAAMISSLGHRAPEC